MVFRLYGPKDKHYSISLSFQGIVRGLFWPMTSSCLACSQFFWSLSETRRKRRESLGVGDREV